MPLYEYECNKCEHAFTRVLSIEEMEAGNLDCPQCGADDVKKLISSGSVKTGMGGYAGKVK